MIAPGVFFSLSREEGLLMAVSGTRGVGPMPLASGAPAFTPEMVPTLNVCSERGGEEAARTHETAMGRQGISLERSERETPW